MSDYWERRANELELLTQRKTDETVKAVNECFSHSISYINSQVKAVFDRYTKNGGLTETQALEMLNTKQTAEFREKLLQRLSRAESKEERKAITTLLDAPAYAHRISMLEALANEVYAEAVTIGAFQNTALTQRLVDIYEQSYYRRTFDIQQYAGEYYDFERLSSGRVKTAISQPWNGKNYSERVWVNTFDTAEKLRDIVVTGIMTGQSYDIMTDSLIAVLGINSDEGARFKASRLIRTEVNYISGKATTKAYEQAGVDEYIYLATLDIKTCKSCGNAERKSCVELDGKHFKVKDAKASVNKHPMHPFCRCSDRPYIPGRKLGVRAARDENGKSIQVPGDMTYEQWCEEYVDNSGKNGIINIDIDELVPCLRNAKTGELLETEVTELSRKQVKKYNVESKWNDDWSKRPNDEHIFGVFLKNDTEPQGLISLRYDEGGTYIASASTAPWNNKLLVGEDQKYLGVGGHLFALAIEESLKHNGYGTIYGFATNSKVLEHYKKEFGAKHFPIVHEYQFIIDGTASKNLLDIYNYERR